MAYNSIRHQVQALRPRASHGTVCVVLDDGQQEADYLQSEEYKQLREQGYSFVIFPSEYKDL